MKRPPHIFRPKARLLLLLGDQLIRDASLAVFELVKNAYDADATHCTVRIDHPTDARRCRVIVEDDGIGMSLKTIENVWLVPGTLNKLSQREAKHRTPRYHRLPLGEKGVGRFAAHKLGRMITMVTRSTGEDEVVVEVNWDHFAGDKNLSEVPVSVETREPREFVGRRSGTRLIVTNLHGPWARGDVRKLYRAVNSICSPFRQVSDFETRLKITPSSDWLEGLLDTQSVLDVALFRATGTIEGDGLSYDYEFKPLPAMKSRIEGRKLPSRHMHLRRLEPKSKLLDLNDWRIGRVDFDFYIYDREPQVLELSTSDKTGLKQFLNQNGGVRVYRDGVRVFDYGEPGNDWLDLGGRRVNIPTVRISNNQVLGAITLSGEDSTDLQEKTNREGFVENDAYEALRQATLFALTQIEADRKFDKERLRKQYSRKKLRRPVTDELADLRRELEKRNLIPELGRHLDRIETQFLEAQEQLLTAAGPGLMLVTVVHEVGKIIEELTRAVRQRAPRERVVQLVENLAKTVDGLAFLARRSGSSREKASTLIEQALFNVSYRLRAHEITVVNGVKEKRNPDFTVKCTRRLVIATLMNFIDNSIYWLEQRGHGKKMLYIGTTNELEGGPALLVADNGPGFQDPPETLVEPFFSRKADGMGLGLHIASEIAKMHEGRLVFPEKGDVSLPANLTGAVVALQFPPQP